MSARRDTDLGGPDDRFPPTRHSVVRNVADPDPDVRQRAWETLIATYWKPVYKCLRLKWRADNEDAKDLTQGFFAWLLEKGALDRFDPDRAKFRTYLRVCLDGFASNERKAAVRLKRGGAFRHVPLDFEDAEGELRRHEIPADADVDEIFHREWVRSLFSLAVDALRLECDRTGRAVAFEVFRRYDLDDTGTTRPTYADLAASLDIPVTKVTNALHAMRRRFRTIVLERLRDTCASEAEFRAEARELLGVDPS